MNELVFRTGKGAPVTSSLLVANKFNKEHKHVLEAIRELMRSAEKAAHFFKSDIYTDSMNRKQELFLMNRDGFSLLVMGFTGDKALNFKLEFIEAFNALEKQVEISHQFKIPQTLSEALQLAADQAKQIELQETQIKELEPKAEVFEQIANADNLMALNEVAKSIGMGRNILMNSLREKSIFRKNNTPYQQYIDSGYFVVKIKAIVFNGSTGNYPQTYCTGKGLTWLSKMFNN